MHARSNLFFIPFIVVCFGLLGQGANGKPNVSACYGSLQSYEKKSGHFYPCEEKQ